MPPRIEPAPLATFQRPPPHPPDKYATIRTGGKYDKSHKYAQQVEREEAAATLERRPPPKRQINQRGLSDKPPNGVSIVNQPLPEPPASVPLSQPSLPPQPLSAAHFTQPYRSPAPPTLPCTGGQHRSHATQGRAGRTPEKFFSTSSQGATRPQRPAYSHTLDRRHAHAQQQQQQQHLQQGRSGVQTLDRRSRQGGSRSANLQHENQQQGEGNKDMYAVTEL